MVISFNSLGNYGRLGNQMFQYAALKGIAINRGYEFCIPAEGHRLFEVFEMSGNDLKEENPLVMYSLTHQGFEFDKNLFDTCPNHTDLYGYFQTEKYFSSISESIKKDFTFINIDSYILNDMNNIVSIHVRRGDYVGQQTYHPLTTMEYYKRAMQLFDGYKFVLFSDDVEWCQSQEIFKNCKILDVPDHEAMYLMTQCDHNIIANSSFSWWGAWLNKNKNNIVIAPEKWFGPSYSGYNMSDLYPQGWKVL